MSWESLCFSTAWIYDTTLLSQLQVLLWVLAIVAAYIIFRKQLKISKKQNELSNEQKELWERQFEVDVIRYAIDTRIINKNELITIITNCNEELKRNDLTQDKIDFIKSKRAEADDNLPWLNKEIKDFIDQYHRVLNKHPNKFTLQN